MKIRTDFVTNSSSYSSCIVRIDNPVLAEVFEKYKNTAVFSDKIRDCFCSDGIAFSWKEFENAVMSFPPNNTGDILTRLLEVINYVNEKIDRTPEENKTLKAFFDDIEKQKGKIEESYKKVLWIYREDNFGESAENGNGRRVFRFPPKQPDNAIKVCCGEIAEKFSYASVDSYSTESDDYSEILKMKGKTFKIDADDKTFSVKFNISSGIKNIVQNIFTADDKKLEYYDLALYLQKCGYDKIDDSATTAEEWFEEMENNLLLFEELPLLNEEQIKHRTILFLEAVKRSVSEKFAGYIRRYAPKKKNKTFYKGKSFLIGVLPYTTENEVFYAYYAQTKSDTEILVSIKKINKTKLLKYMKKEDLFFTTNLIKEL